MIADTYPERYGNGRYVLQRLGAAEVDEAYVRWMQDPDVIRFLQVRFQPRDLEAIRRFAAGFDFINSFLFGIHEAETGERVGTVTLRCNPHHNFGHIGFMVGARDHWGRSAAKTAIANALTFAFYERGLRKVIGTTTENHAASNHIFASLGFGLDAVVPDLYWSEGAYHGETHYSMTSENWAERLEREPAQIAPPPTEPWE